jgi:NAD(P)-dependent dehydrogenase (short-subunit alcohol dehydrogenase family)
MKTWLITGCSTGFGRELAEAVLARGDRAAVTARDPQTVADVVAPHADKAIAIKLDVTDAKQIEAAVKAAMEKFGRIDVLVNNAGIGYFGALEESEEDEVRRMFEINFWGLVHMTQAVLPIMRAQNAGTIVNISSVAGMKGNPAVSFYNATKFAVEGLSEALQLEVEPFGIRVLAVEPSGFRTDWAGRSANETQHPIPEYDGAPARKRMEALRAASGRQPGDPKKAAEAIIADVEKGGPNHHLPLGNASFDITIKKIDDLKAEYAPLEEIARGADDVSAAPEKL